MERFSKRFWIFALLIGLFVLCLFFTVETTSSSGRDNVVTLGLDGDSLNVYYFYGEGCLHCSNVKPFLAQMEQHYSLVLHKYDIYSNRSCISLFDEYSDRFGLSQGRRAVPAIFVSDSCFVGDTPILEGFEETVKKALNNSSLSQVLHGKNLEISSLEAALTPETVSLLTVTAAALVDSISPCSITILVFLIGARILTRDQKKRALKVGLSFCLSVFIAYFLFGIGLLTVVQVSGFSGTFSLFVGLIAVLAGIFYLKDVFWYGKGGFVMEVPRSLKPLLMKMLKGITSPVGAFAMGFVVCLFELPCTGGPYLFILSQLANEFTRSQALPLLLYYNFIFILPLILLSLTLHIGSTQIEIVRAWSIKNKRILNLARASLMLTVGLLTIPVSQVVQVTIIALNVYKTMFTPFIVFFTLYSAYKTKLLYSKTSKLSAVTMLFLACFSFNVPLLSSSLVKPKTAINSDDFALQPLIGDLFLQGDYEVSSGTCRVTDGQEGPIPYQSSLFMIGKISVSVIFLESDGSIDPETEDWSQARVDQVINEIATGLNWFNTKEANARLQWVIHSQVINTSYEPITRSSRDDYKWINEAMDYLGYDVSGSYSSRLRPYVDDLRNADGTHWAFAIFVVDSYNDRRDPDGDGIIDMKGDGKFTDGLFAYAHIHINDNGGGPYLVTTYDAGPYREYSGGNRFDVVIAHETAHTFWAADEYPPCRCDLEYGFLGILNLNCTSGCDKEKPWEVCDGGNPPECQGCYDNCYTSGCLMETGEHALVDQCLTISTKHQLGWRDLDKDGILDAIDSTYNSWIDTDGDGVIDYLDNCPNTVNPNQTDTDEDWIGDACEICNLHILSPQNKTYSSESVPLIFTVREAAWIGYSVDGQENMTVAGNTTLYRLFNGSHSLIVYANDTSGNMEASTIIHFTIELSHDVAVIEIWTSKANGLQIPTVGQGYDVTIYVTVENQGTYTESLNVTAYANSTAIGETQIILNSGEHEILPFSWDTIGFDLGNHSTSAIADIVPGEVYIDDNLLIYGWILVTVPGDVNGDGDVDLYDAVRLLTRYGTEEADPNYDSNCDLDNDGQVFHLDSAILLSYYGQSWQP